MNKYVKDEWQIYTQPTVTVKVSLDVLNSNFSNRGSFSQKHRTDSNRGKKKKKKKATVSCVWTPEFQSTWLFLWFFN